jgi:hypothetical protein
MTMTHSLEVISESMSPSLMSSTWCSLGSIRPSFASMLLSKATVSLIRQYHSTMALKTKKINTAMNIAMMRTIRTGPMPNSS